MNAIKQFNGLEAADLPAGRPLHLAVGMFDGLHRGHQAVIAAAVHGVRRDHGIAAVLTFWPHPSALFRPGDATPLIMSPAEKARVLGLLGIEAVITQPFTAKFAALDAAEFLPRLKKALTGLSMVYVGENWRFGRGRTGDVALLQRTAAGLGVGVVGVPRVRHRDAPISSTRIRAAIEAGDVGTANAMLGHPYFAQGRVKPGRGIGRTIGFPTLNLDWTPGLPPRHGVYAVEVSRVGGSLKLPGVANYGVRPTVEAEAAAQLEVHMLGECPFGGGDELVVEFRHFIRPEQKFPDLAALKAQIAADRAAAEAWLASNKDPWSILLSSRTGYLTEPL